MFKLETQGRGRHEAIREGTRRIMEALAELLPEEYRGAYASSISEPEVKSIHVEIASPPKGKISGSQ